MYKEDDKIIKHLSLYYRIPVVEVEAMIKSQFAFVKHIIEQAEKDKEETFKTIKLPTFGMFTLKKGKLKYITKNKKANAIKNRKNNLERS